MRRLISVSLVILILTLTACSAYSYEDCYVEYEYEILNGHQFEVLLGTGLPPMECWPSPGVVLEARELPLDTFYELTFNTTTEPVGMWFVSPASYPDETMRNLEYCEQSKIFPTIDLPNLRSHWVIYSYGKLAEINKNLGGDFAVLLGVGGIRDTRTISIHDDDFIPEISYVHGVPVRVLMVRYSETGSGYWFQADFAMGSIVYRVRFRGTMERGKERMTELVNKIIWGGTEGLYSAFEIEK